MNFINDEKGLTSIEYGMVCAFVFLVFLGAFTYFAHNATDMWVVIAKNLVE